MSSRDPDGPGLSVARKGSDLARVLPQNRTTTGIKAKFFDQDSERDLVGMALAWPDHAADIVSKIDNSHLGDELAKKAIITLRELVKTNGVISASTVAQNVSDWPTAASDLLIWMVNAPYYSEREVNSRVLAIRTASDNRQLYKAGEMLCESLDSGNQGGTKAALNRLTELSQSTVNGTSGFDLSPLQVNFSALFSKESVRREFLVEPWLPSGSQIALYSEPKAGKSLLTLELSVVLATGKAGLGMECREPISVMYLDYENTEDDLIDRLESMGFTEADNLSNLHYFQLVSIPPLDTLEGGQWIREAVKEFEPKLVIIDTMARAVAGEENSADTFRRYYQHVGLFLKSQKVTLLRLDHAGKDATKGQRGSSDKAGDVDGVYRLSATGNHVMLSCTHQRISWIAEKVRFTRLSEPLRHEPENQPFSRPGTDLARTLDELNVPLDAKRSEILDLLKKAGFPGRRVTTISEAQKIRNTRNSTRNSYSGTLAGTSGNTFKKATRNRLLPGDIRREQSTEYTGNTQWEQSATPIRGAVPSADFEDYLDTHEEPLSDDLDSAMDLAESQLTQAEPTCKICGSRLLFPASIERGICARKDEAHRSYASSDQPPPLTDADIARFEAMFEDEAEAS